MRFRIHLAVLGILSLCGPVKALLCMNRILRDIGSHTHVNVADKDTGNIVKRPCLFACTDQTYSTSVTTSTFPNLHTFVRGAKGIIFLSNSLFETYSLQLNEMTHSNVFKNVTQSSTIHYPYLIIEWEPVRPGLGLRCGN